MKNAIIVVGLGWGDEGKGSIVDYLTRKYDSGATVKFSGGAQASHAVVLPSGITHRFHQWGSGTFSHVSTILAKDFLVNPIAMFAEHNELCPLMKTDPWDLMFVDPNAKITTPYHTYINRLQELTREHRHGSCGMGIGMTMQTHIECPSSTIYAADLQFPDIVKEKLLRLQYHLYPICNTLISLDLEGIDNEKCDSINHYLDLYNSREECDSIIEVFQHVGSQISYFYPQISNISDETVIFEGSQGTKLTAVDDSPYCTWADTTPKSIVKELKSSWNPPNIKIVGVTRTYTTRHGEGPFDEAPELKDIVDPNNLWNPWQGEMRKGWLDPRNLGLINESEGIIYDSIALTHMDIINQIDGIRLLSNKDHLYGCSEGIIVEIESYARDVSIVSSGPTYNDKILRRPIL
jgi:adenylosuccinate synthase